MLLDHANDAVDFRSEDYSQALTCVFIPVACSFRFGHRRPVKTDRHVDPR